MRLKNELFVADDLMWRTMLSIDNFLVRNYKERRREKIKITETGDMVDKRSEAKNFAKIFC